MTWIKRLAHRLHKFFPLLSEREREDTVCQQHQGKRKGWNILVLPAVMGQKMKIRDDIAAAVSLNQC